MLDLRATWNKVVFKKNKNNLYQEGKSPESYHLGAKGQFSKGAQVATMLKTSSSCKQGENPMNGFWENQVGSWRPVVSEDFNGDLRSLPFQTPFFDFSDKMHPSFLPLLLFLPLQLPKKNAKHPPNPPNPPTFSAFHSRFPPPLPNLFPTAMLQEELVKLGDGLHRLELVLREKILHLTWRPKTSVVFCEKNGGRFCYCLSKEKTSSFSWKILTWKNIRFSLLLSPFWETSGFFVTFGPFVFPLKPPFVSTLASWTSFSTLPSSWTEGGTTVAFVFLQVLKLFWSAKNFKQKKCLTCLVHSFKCFEILVDVPQAGLRNVVITELALQKLLQKPLKPPQSSNLCSSRVTNPTSACRKNKVLRCVFARNSSPRDLTKSRQPPVVSPPRKTFVPQFP